MEMPISDALSVLNSENAVDKGKVYKSYSFHSSCKSLEEYHSLAVAYTPRLDTESLNFEI